MQGSRGAIKSNVAGDRLFNGERVQRLRFRNLMDETSALQHVQKFGFKNRHVSIGLLERMIIAWTRPVARLRSVKPCRIIRSKCGTQGWVYWDLASQSRNRLYGAVLHGDDSNRINERDIP